MDSQKLKVALKIQGWHSEAHRGHALPLLASERLQMQLEQGSKPLCLPMETKDFIPHGLYYPQVSDPPGINPPPTPRHNYNDNSKCLY